MRRHGLPDENKKVANEKERGSNKNSSSFFVARAPCCIEKSQRDQPPPPFVMLTRGMPRYQSSSLSLALECLSYSLLCGFASLPGELAAGRREMLIGCACTLFRNKFFNQSEYMRPRAHNISDYMYYMLALSKLVNYYL